MGRLDDPIESVRLGLYVRTRPQRLVEAYRLAIDIANRPKIRSLCSGSPPTEPQHDELETFLRAEAVPHAVGTCAMGLRLRMVRS